MSKIQNVIAMVSHDQEYVEVKYNKVLVNVLVSVTVNNLGMKLLGCNNRWCVYTDGKMIRDARPMLILFRMRYISHIVQREKVYHEHGDD